MTNVYWGVHGAVSAGANPSLLLVGDSWLWYPMDNLATEIGAALPSQALVVAGYNGAEAAEWNAKYRKEIDLAFQIYGASVSALLLSGGGNDIAGMRDFLRLLEDNCSKATTIADCYRVAQPDEILTMIMGCYRGVIVKFRAYNQKALVLMHNYDYAWPTGKGVFGPSDWLRAPMDKAKVPKALRRDLFKDLIMRLRAAQLALRKETALGALVVVKSAGTMPDDDATKDQWWANELHPTPKGFKLITRKAILPELAKIGIR